ncbi:uncharacterized protein [Heptranchias perlo]|uniref:uncharacterized protein isoform X1 n=1 Tax=Heptranchias perlo TaxID=212740 RepID=UPI003559A47C
MKCLILGVSLRLGLLNSGTAQDEHCHEIGNSPRLVITNGSRPVLLPCSDPSPDQITKVQWIFSRARGKTGMRLCTVDKKNPQCSSPQYPDVKLAESDGFKTGNYSLWFTATMRDGGYYRCNLYGEPRRKDMAADVWVISVSVTPAGPISLGSSVSLTCEISGPSFFKSLDWKIKNTSVTSRWGKIEWKRNRMLIHQDKRHKFDFRSLHINKFQHSDAGRYTYTIMLKDGMSWCYSRLLEIPEPSHDVNPIVKTPATTTSEGPYINVPLQRKTTEQDSTDLNSTYMGLDLKEQSVYSQVQR